MSEKGLTFFYFYDKNFKSIYLSRLTSGKRKINSLDNEEDGLSSKKSKLEEELEVWWKFDLNLFGFIIHLTGSAKPDMESQR
jgi:hypothetical protein